MPPHVDYYVSLNSPWAHLGAARIEAMTRASNATVCIYPVDYSSIFASSGGLPLAKRAPQRRAYRMMELRRWRDHLEIPIQLEPKFFPSNEQHAASSVIALRETKGNQPAIRLAHRVLKALWEEDKDPGDLSVLADLIQEIGEQPEPLLALAAEPRWAERRLADTKAALERGVFGAPAYVIDHEIFWGQDRLMFVEKRLARG